MPPIENNQLGQLEDKLLYVLLYRNDKYSFLPELLDIVGTEKIHSFLRLFAGSTITFPPARELERQAAAIRIYLRLRKLDGMRRPDVIRDLASYYSMSEENVMKLYKSVEVSLKEVGFKL